MELNETPENTTARCTNIQIFYRICGHVEFSYKHTTWCALAESRGLGDGLVHWNPLPYNIKPLYVVGLCMPCLAKLKYNGHLRPMEPARNVDRGTGEFTQRPWLGYEPDKLQELALTWRNLVEEDERVPRAEERKRERDLIAKRTVREHLWNSAWATHCEYNVGDDRAKILDLTDDLSRPRTADDLLAPYQPKADEDCSFCQLALSEAPGDDPNEAPKPVRFTRGCMHDKAHYRCVLTLLVAGGHRECPQCRQPHKFVLKNTNEDPVFRWVWSLDSPQNEKALYQVSGHITFQDGFADTIDRRDPFDSPFAQDADSIECRKRFQPFMDEDRWGDSYQDGTPSAVEL